jgi:acyl transferase domain-containing protein/acyl carrier protein
MDMTAAAGTSASVNVRPLGKVNVPGSAAAMAATAHGTRITIVQGANEADSGMGVPSRARTDVRSMFRISYAQSRRGMLEPPLVCDDRERPVMDPVVRANAAREPIAIVGMACRLPGPAIDVDAYWDLLQRGESAITEVPADRWNIDALYDPDPATPHHMYARHGGFVQDLDRFDAALFEISPREAQTLDPQQRLLLEVSWEALERAGLSASDLRGSDTGVFVGMVGSAEYSDRLKRNLAIDADLYAGTGNAPSVAAGRVAYCFGFHGPALAVDTACSSSLLSVHLAMQSLRRGECGLALAGGVNAILSPITTMVLCRGHMLSARGRCATFDAEADGYVRGEGCGMVVLETLSRALEARHRILGVLRGSAVNQDGRSSGLTAPSGIAQEALLREALADAGVTPDDVSYVEAHGTGTRLGDPIEIRALQAVFGARPATDPLRVGSVKTNIGHLEAAAGVAALIKVLASLEHNVIPAHLNFRTPNPAIDWSAAPVEVAVEAMPWAHADRRRIAGISAFAFSGTNVHLLVEEPPRPEPREASSRAGHLVTLSARTESSLRRQAGRLADWLDRHSLPLEDVAYTMNAGRARLEHRAAFVATSIADARKRLVALGSDGTTAAGAETGVVGGGGPRLAFLYTGQGSQTPGVGRELFHSQPVFRSAVEECDAVFDAVEGARVCDWLYGDVGEHGTDVQRIGLAQPALFAIEYALTQLWRSWGVRPGAVVGHSVGEIAAACTAGALSLKDAASVVAGGGRLLPSLPANGGMRAVRGDMAQVSSLLAGGDLSVWISSLNAPDETVVAGLLDDIVRFDERCRGARLPTSPLNAVHAFHTPLMTPMVDQWRATVQTMTPRPPSIPLISTLTGRALPAGVLMDTDYWCRQIRSPVAFSSAIQELASAGYDTFVEIGPHPLLTLLGRRSVPSKACVWLGSLRRGRSDWLQMQGTLGALFARGVEFDARALAAPDHPRRVALPGYPFERRRWWIDAYQGPEPLGAATSASAVLVHSALSGERLRQHVVDPGRDVVASDYRVFGDAVYPAAGFLAQIVMAAAEARPDAAVEVRDFTVHRPLVFPTRGPRLLQTALQDTDARMSAAVFSARGGAAAGHGEWTRHVSAEVTLADDILAREAVVAPPGKPTPDEVAGLYDDLAGRGVVHGASYRLVEAVRADAGRSVARLRVPAILDGDVRLALRIDSALQALGSALQTVVRGRADATWLPVSIARLSIDPRAASVPWRAIARSRLDGADDASEETIGDVWCFDDNGRLIMAAEGCAFRRTSRDVLQGLAPDETDTWLHEITWRPATDAAREPVQRDWFVLGDPRGAGAALVERLGAGPAPARGPVEHARLVEAPDVAALAAAAAGHGASRGLVDLRGLDVGTGTPDETAETAVDRLLALAQDIARQPAGAALELVVVTRGATGSAATPAGLAGAAIAGFSRVFAQEHPDLSVRTIDVDADATAETIAAALADELTHVVDEPDLAIRGARRWIPRLTRVSPRPASAAGAEAPIGRRAGRDGAPRPDGSYLITGGLGGVGLTLASDLAARGARHLILMGRSAPGPFAVEVVARLASAGVSVRVEAADVTNADDVARVLSAIPADRPLRGVLHAAGVLDDALVEQMTPERVHRVFAPKVRGAWVLHTLTRSSPLDFFVFCSSVSAVFGSPGQSTSAAANAWLDALARLRTAEGLPGLSVNWGAWSDVGMAARLSGSQRDRWAARGFALIPPAMGGNALWRALKDERPQLVVQPVDWTVFGRSLGSQRVPPLLSELVPRTSTQHASAAVSLGDERVLLAETPADQRADRLRDHVRRQIAQVLGLDSTVVIDDDQPLTELGIDSLMAVELSNRLNVTLGQSLAPTVAFEFPTVAGITAHLLDGLRRAADETAGGAPEPGNAILREVSSLDAAAVDELLGQLEPFDDTSSR